VVVRTPEVTDFIAGDATYAEVLLKERVVDGLAGDMRAYLDTLERIAAFARSEPTVLLPSHDPLAGDRLAERITLTDFDFAARNAAQLPSRFSPEKKLAHLAAVGASHCGPWFRMAERKQREQQAR
jgi:glyoxylase-like metal-dependent hydrolase (beta-lactamase superfamily II)